MLLRPQAFWKPGEAFPSTSAPPRPSLVVDADSGEPEAIFGSGGPGWRLKRQQLPVFQHRRAILYSVENHATTILVGETGSGKSTQVPQYLAEAGWCAGGRMVACTQPRRVAVQTVAARVAEEMGCPIGERVGYTIRFEDVTTPGKTQIKFLTDGVLLREMLGDPLLHNYSVIMVDEAHERSVATDLLLGLLKKVQKRRPDLRLIISSASLATEEFRAFFDPSAVRRKAGHGAGESGAGVPEGAPTSRAPAVLSIEGRCHPVQLLYLEEATSDYVQRTVDTILDIHGLEGPGDVLAFVTGREEADTVVQLLAEAGSSRGGQVRGLMPMPLYAGLPSADVERVFAPVFRGQRKVVVATNIAEASITLEGVVYVVDCGFVKQRFFNPESGVDALLTVPVSRASARQRAGRAGRTCPGKCFRLYTETAYRTLLPPHSVPEMQRSNLCSTVLQLKSMGVDNLMRFDWLSPPPPDLLAGALETLFAIRALDSDARLTQPLGLQLAEIPLEPMVGRMLVAAAECRCSEEAATVAACLSVQSVWESSRGRQREADEMRSRFAAAEGDLITFLNVHEGFERSGHAHQWCIQNGINFQAMVRVSEIRQQLRRLLSRGLGLPLASSGRDASVLQRAAAAAFFPNAAELLAHGDGMTYRAVRSGAPLRIHPSSALFRVSPRWVVYREASRGDSGQLQMRDVTVVEREWLTAAAPHFFQGVRAS